MSGQALLESKRFMEQPDVVELPLPVTWNYQLRRESWRRGAKRPIAGLLKYDNVSPFAYRSNCQKLAKVKRQSWAGDVDDHGPSSTVNSAHEVRLSQCSSTARVRRIGRRRQSTGQCDLY